MKELTNGFAPRSGASLFVVTVMMTSLTVVSTALFTMSSSASREQKGSREDLSALYVAEAALNEAFADIANAGPGVVALPGQPAKMGSSDYWVEAVDIGGGMTSLVATAEDAGRQSRLEMVVQEVEVSMFSWAAFGDEGLTMDSNARVDSYDSGLGSYDDQDLNGSGSSKYASVNGNVGSNASVAMDQNSKVWGDAVPGPGHTTTVLGNATVSGTTIAALNLVDLPEIDVPAIASTGSLSVSGSQTLPSGMYNFDELHLDGNASLVIQGPATIVTGRAQLDSNSEMLIDAGGGPVEIYVINDFEVNSNTLIASTTYTPADVAINLLSDNVFDPDLNVDLDVVDFDSNAQIYGTIYAPSARVEINSNFELFGSLVARSVHLDSNSRIHFDEALMTAANRTEIEFRTLCWRRVPRSYAAAPMGGEQ